MEDHFSKPTYNDFCNKLYHFLFCHDDQPLPIADILRKYQSLLVPSCAKFLDIHEPFPMHDLRMRSGE